ncbi:hypothetical protein [Methylacidimicrobium sp. B4]|uniref:hypothetical protein n=1 Tax=Methylacidimicrobium sp. B4 TaxID=2796139 RepID=UPI001A8C11BE|nr:hypothetical protein [Methylacidimicrobium sp. B4]QSR85465.1 hypothetical protein MacB4_04330 [Methylacidimicrobium sp. B4]
MENKGRLPGLLHRRKAFRNWTAIALAGGLGLSGGATAPRVEAAQAVPLGQVRGVGTLVQNGLRVPLDGGAFPAASGARLETQGGALRVNLLDGSWVQLGPYGAATLEKTPSGLLATVASGLLRFHLPSGVHASFQTERMHAVSEGAQVRDGEILAGPLGSTSVFMTQGSLPVEELGTHRVSVATVASPVDLGAGAAKIRRTPHPAGLAEGDAELPAGAKPVFGADGRSLGYIPKGGGFVSSPGVVPPLSHPIAESKIPSMLPGATPVFDKHGNYLGFVKSGVFNAKLENDPDFTPFIVVGAVVAGVGAGVGSAAAVIRQPSAPPVTPTSP